MKGITEDEDTFYAKAFEKCLTELAAEVYGIHEPFEIAQRTLRTACEFYEADWCGMFDADMMLVCFVYLLLVFVLALTKEEEQSVKKTIKGFVGKLNKKSEN